MLNKLVLIVEDNARNLELVQDILEFRGFQTLTASSGNQAVELARLHHPDVVLMDIQLPDIDGVAALSQLRSNLDTARIPVLALTAFAMSADQSRLLEAGFDAYIPKPIDVRSLPEIVLRYCEATS